MFVQELLSGQVDNNHRKDNPRESEGMFFTGVGLSVCLSVTKITKKIVDGFVPNL